MKRKQVTHLRMLVQCLLIGSSLALQAGQSLDQRSVDQRSVGQRSFDPMIDFRSPHSLTEVLQEGFIAVEAGLKACENNPDEMEEYLSRASSELQRLHGSYDDMINRSKVHTVYRDDREFLQRMIDRIDSMIEVLEGSSDKSERSGMLLSESRDLVRQFQDKI